MSKSICIIGAGISGITAALELQNKYKITNIDIYDAMDYIGGRVKSNKFGIKGDNDQQQSTPVELGAQWMHALGVNKLYRLIRDNLDKNHFILEKDEQDMSIKVNKADEDDEEEEDKEKKKEEGDGKDGEDGDDDADEEEEPPTFGPPEAFMYAKDIACDKVPKDIADIYFGILEEIDNLKDEDYQRLNDSYGAFINEQIEQSLIDDFNDESDNLKKWVKCIFKAMQIYVDGSDQLDKVSLTSQSWLEGTDTGEKLMKFPLQNLLQFLSEQVKTKISLRHIVEHCQLTTNGEKVDVIIRNCNDNSFQWKTYDFVISTIPIEAFKCYGKNLLQQFLYQQVDWNAWSMVEGGKFEKVFIEFANSLENLNEDNKRLWVMIGNENDDDGDWTRKMILLQQLDKKATKFMFYLTKDNAQLMLKDNLDEIRCKIIKRLKASTDCNIPDIINISRTNWAKQSWIQCSYSFVKCEAEEDVFDKITQPLKNKNGKNVIFFAGEHTHKSFYGSMHGAYESGLRVANDIANEL